MKETEPVVVDPILDTLLADTFDPALDLPGTVPEPVLNDPLVKKVGEFNVQGKDNADYHIHIRYCGAWDYRPQAIKLINTLDEDMPDTFRYVLKEDKAKTGNFEVKMHLKKDMSDQGELFYSKKKTGKFPHVNDAEWCKFLDDMPPTNLYEDWNLENNTVIS